MRALKRAGGPLWGLGSGRKRGISACVRRWGMGASEGEKRRGEDVCAGCVWPSVCVHKVPTMLARLRHALDSHDCLSCTAPRNWGRGEAGGLQYLDRPQCFCP